MHSIALSPCHAERVAFMKNFLQFAKK
jgi:hypothetical protein